MTGRRRWIGGGVALLVVAGLLAWPRLRSGEVDRFRQTLLEADASTKEVGVPIGGRFYRSGELQTAAAPTLVGPSAPRHHSVEPPYGEPVAAIVDFRDRLAEEGVELWVLPMPVRPWVAPHQVRQGGLPLPGAVYSDAYRGFIDTLEAEGVPTMDMLPALRRRAAWFPDEWIHRTDPHWTGQGVVLVASTLAERLRDAGLVPSERSVHTRAAWRTVKRSASSGGIDLPDEPDEEIDLRRIRLAEEVDGSRTVPVRHEDAQVVVFGDSHVVWYDGYGADIVRQLIHETGMPIDALPIVGGGATRAREELARRAWADPDYLPAKKVAIWVFWTENLWSDRWGIVSLEPIGPSKLARRQAGVQLDVDRHLIVGGRGEASFGFRWSPPEPGEDDQDVAWIRKPDPGRIRWHGPVAEGSSLILELRAKKPHPVAIDFDGKPLVRFEQPRGVMRHRVPIPAGPEQEHVLSIGIDAESPPKYELGLKHLTLLSTPRLHEVSFDRDTEMEGLDAEARIPSSGPRLAMVVELGADPGAAVVRARARSLARKGWWSLTVNGTPVMARRPLPRAWSEHAIELPAGVLQAGSNELVWSAGPGEAAVGWDVVEIDALAPVKR